MVIAEPIIPIKMATNMEITTHTDAILLEVFNLFSSSIPIKRSRICGMPKYPSPHASVDAMVRLLYGTDAPAAGS